MQPIFNFGKLKRQEQVARERYYQSVFAYEETVLEALGDVEKSLLDIATYRSQAENYARLLRANIEIATMTNSLYRNGMSAYLDVIDAERNMYQSQMEYVNLVAQQYINYVNLFKGAGRAAGSRRRLTGRKSGCPAPCCRSACKRKKNQNKFLLLLSFLISQISLSLLSYVLIKIFF